MQEARANVDNLRDSSAAIGNVIHLTRGDRAANHVACAQFDHRGSPHGNSRQGFAVVANEVKALAVANTAR